MAKEKELVNKVTPEQMREMASAALEANEELIAEGASWVNTQSFIPANIGSMGGFRETNEGAIHRFMKEADQAYREVGIVRNVVDIMTDFASEGLDIIHPIPSQERFYRAWAQKVDLIRITKELLQGLFKWGNVGVFRFWGKIRPKTRKEMMAKARELFKQGRDAEAVKAFFKDNTKFQKSRIPVRYTCLPPFHIKIHGSILFPQRFYFYQLSQADIAKLQNPEKNASPLEKSLIKEIPNLKNLNMIGEAGLIPLPPENFQMFHYKKDCARLWADPMILPIMDDLRFKKVLRRMDISVAESIINPITVFKLGKTVEGFPPTKEMFQNLASLLKKPVMTKTLIWNDLLEVEQKTVDAREVLTQDKYKQLNADILAGLGVSQVLINGGDSGGGGFSSSFLSVRTLLERLEDSRETILAFLEGEFAAIAKAMGFKRPPKILWGRMNLRDEAAEKRIIIELLDRKLISAESARAALGYDNDIEMQRKIREEITSRKSGITISVGPYEQQVQVQKLTQQIEDGTIDNTNNEFPVKNGPSPGPGRPPNKGDTETRKQKVVRDTKPQGMGEIIEKSWVVDPDLYAEANQHRAVIENFLKPRYLKSLNKDNLRQLTNQEKDIYDKLVLVILSHTKPNQTITEDWVKEKATQLAEGPAKLDRCVAQVTTQLVKDYRKKSGQAPSTKKRKELESRAWAICRKQLGV